jgi:hypothetical protein
MMKSSKAVMAAIAVITILAHAGAVNALDTCKATIRGKDGTILISAKNVDGPLQWGWSSGTEDNAFFDPACVKGTKAKNCTQEMPASLLGTTAPPECNIYLADDSGSCSAYVKKCQPGKRPVVEFPTRFIDHGDGTITDTRTGLMWQQTTNDGSIRDKDNLYRWSTGSPYNPDGTAFFTFLATLNGPTPFAGYGDWRLPSPMELQTIVDLAAPGCGSGSACIDQTVFGPTQSYYYWSASTYAPNPSGAWVVGFDVGNVLAGVKALDSLYVRAVRSGS